MKVQCPNCKTLYEKSGTKISDKGMKVIFTPDIKTIEDDSLNMTNIIQATGK